MGGIWALRGSYLWRRVLEASNDAFLRSHYESIFGRQSAAELLEATTVYLDTVAVREGLEALMDILSAD